LSVSEVEEVRVVMYDDSLIRVRVIPGPHLVGPPEPPTG
jgi:hypothetical protein